MPAAIIGGAIAGVGAIGAAAIGSGAQGRASREATQATANATRENNALAREIYGQNRSTLSPYINTGYAANNAISALLGLSTNDNAPQAGMQPQTGALAAYGMQQPQTGMGYPTLAGYHQMMEQGGGWQPQQDNGTGVLTAPAPTATTAPAGPSQYQSAFDNYRNSTGYQFRVGEGMKALNSGYAAKGMLQSGAAQKAALQYGQNIASGEFANYLGQLTNQQGVGLSAGNALAGVSTNYANSVAGQNNAQASVIANAALAQGQANAGLWGTAANAFGQLGGSLISSYGR